MRDEVLGRGGRGRRDRVRLFQRSSRHPTSNTGCLGRGTAWRASKDLAASGMIKKGQEAIPVDDDHPRPHWIVTDIAQFSTPLGCNARFALKPSLAPFIVLIIVVQVPRRRTHDRQRWLRRRRRRQRSGELPCFFFCCCCCCRATCPLDSQWDYGPTFSSKPPAITGRCSPQGGGTPWGARRTFLISGIHCWCRTASRCS